MNCPGFWDNDDFEINVTNAVTIKNVISQANTIKLLILLNFQTFASDKQKALEEMIKIASDLFGNRENLFANKASFLIAITHIPVSGNGNSSDLENIKSDFKDHKFVNSLVERVIAFDSLHDEPLKGGVKRIELITKLKKMKPIIISAEIINNLLIPADILKKKKAKREEVKQTRNSQIQQYIFKIKNAQQGYAIKVLPKQFKIQTTIYAML